MVGDIAILAIFPLVMFFGTGILTKEDFNNFLWTVIMLAMGGIALGRAVSSSGLLNEIALSIRDHIGGLSLYQVLIVFSILILIATTFISHTVGALVILPIVLEVGKHLEDPHPQLLVLACGFMTSVGMGLPVSSFPNMNAVCIENDAGKCYLSTVDFMRVGLPSSVVVWGVCMTIGYGLMLTLGLK
jgi:di/tricarboxylate transporter